MSLILTSVRYEKGTNVQINVRMSKKSSRKVLAMSKYSFDKM